MTPSRSWLWRKASANAMARRELHHAIPHTQPTDHTCHPRPCMAPPVSPRDTTPKRSYRPPSPLKVQTSTKTDDIAQLSNAQHLRQGILPPPKPPTPPPAPWDDSPNPTPKISDALITVLLDAAPDLAGPAWWKSAKLPTVPGASPSPQRLPARLSPPYLLQPLGPSSSRAMSRRRRP